MKQALHLKIGQHLTMTPQLQQAIRLLQLSTLDLQQEIQQALESNPLLEISEDDTDTDIPVHLSSDNQRELSTEPSSNDREEVVEHEAEAEHDWNDQIPEDLPTDSSWEDTFQHQSSGSSSDSEWADNENDSREDTLLDHLNWQLNLTPMSDADRLIAEAIIEAIDPDGYLQVSVDELMEQFVAQFPDIFSDIDLDEVIAVLHRVQQFDPPGVAARDLSECLSIQIKQLPDTLPWRETALKLANEHLQLLGNHDYKALMRKLRLNEEDLSSVIEIIQSLNPKPGASIASSQSEYVIPDVVVRKVQDQWIVSLSPETSPKLQINTQYADLIRRADNSADNTYLKNHLQEARWFLKSLMSRNETLLKVATEIVERQKDFLEMGEEGMKPMVLHDIAEAVSMHESTISRVTTQKFIHTPRGIFELKYFFSSQVNTADGEGASSTAIRALIKKLVTSENTAKPLSDNKIAQLLMEQGINVARRTVAKYREALGIPPSNERKRLL
ncbi:RNA polymerase factor sigma-54 [Nitrincola nitratireducens]|uniref:RNA polymerase sigma-54 factor n=1 Tax=Nitrincola nitratireducens TaxID=1229521 RepID=W9UZN9_9GAMM|nr:RNA polymerase factor sigma-54 [Nitrincola nitratireducens]EXJ12718.1 RNA polymerase factor sigma-54 [Nitrincola nitratireducens]